MCHCERKDLALLPAAASLLSAAYARLASFDAALAAPDMKIREDRRRREAMIGAGTGSGIGSSASRKTQSVETANGDLRETCTISKN
jgi:hypothetical protein